MSALERIAHYQNRRDEAPNQELAQELAASRDVAGIREIATHLSDKNKNVRSDCLKVLYEIGYLAPELVADYAGEFLKLLGSKDNRMVWGAMIGLGTIAALRPREIGAQIEDVIAAVEKGSVITVVWGVKVLAQVAAREPRLRARVWPVLIKILQTTIPRDVPTHAQSMLVALNDDNRAEFSALLESRRAEMTPAQVARLKKVFKAVGAGA
jgi:hypothetical protein